MVFLSDKSVAGELPAKRYTNYKKKKKNLHFFKSMYEILKQKFPGREKQIEQFDCATASSVRELLILHKSFKLTLPDHS